MYKKNRNELAFSGYIKNKQLKHKFFVNGLFV